MVESAHCRKNGQKNGKGHYFYSSGMRYDGNWKDNERHGEGTIIFEDFTMWSGPWRKGKRHGSGTFTDVDRKRYIEEYRDGELIERKPILDDINQTVVTQTSCETDSSLHEFLDSIKKPYGDTDKGDSSKTSDRMKDPNVKSWSVDVVVKWLDYLKMNEYIELFRENKMEGVSLLNLKEKDLLDMGITSKGHRMLIREGIENLKKLAQPPKPKKIKMHKDYKRKKQVYSLSSEMKLREYYKTVEMIEEEDSRYSAKSDNSGIGSKIKTTSAKIELNTPTVKSDMDDVDELERKNSRNNSIDIDVPLNVVLLSKNNSVQPKVNTDKDGKLLPPEEPRKPNHIKKALSQMKLHDNLSPMDANKSRKASVAETIQSRSDESAVYIDSNPSNVDETSQSPGREERMTQRSDIAVVSPDTSESSDSENQSEEEDTKDLKFVIDLKEIIFEERLDMKLPASENQFETFKGNLYNNSQKVMIRKFKRRKMSDKKLIKEAKVLEGLNHQNIVLFLGISIDPEYLYQITEYMQEGSVYEQLHVKHKISASNLPVIFDLLDSVARAMFFLHGHEIIHGNLNSTSILIDEDWTFKISDFGFNRLREKCHRLRKMKQRITGLNEISPYWFAPEIFRGDKYGFSSDVYSFGILMW